ncbi:uncharacterized protein ACBT57_019505 isoform 1-T1 [Dama dama]
MKSLSFMVLEDQLQCLEELEEGHLITKFLIASELLSPGLGQSVRHPSLSSQSGCLPCVLGALQSQQTSPRRALWVLRLKADCRDYSERDSGDKRGADSGKGMDL